MSIIDNRLLGGSAGGGGGGDKLYIEDVFSTWLYTGDGGFNTITNGIDLAGKGGLVWLKRRTGTFNHFFYDTARGANKYISSNTTAGEVTDTTAGVDTFNSNGFRLEGAGDTNSNGDIFTSWTFRKQAKFFDVVTYTGDGVAGRTVAHNLGSAPGCIIVKRTDTTSNWGVYNRGIGATKLLQLNTEASQFTDTTYWNDTEPSSAVFTVGTSGSTNASGGTYVAYLFAHDTSADGLIQCGSYTGNSSPAGPEINLGWEPQWVLIKNTTNTAGWLMYDNIRGITPAGDALLKPNTIDAEVAGGDILQLLATGFMPTSAGVDANNSGSTYVYIAIRRGPMKAPTDATKVFQPVVYTGTNVDNRLVNTGILTDMVWVRQRNDSVLAGMVVGDRMRGQPYLLTGGTAAEVNDADSFDDQLVSAVAYGTAFSSMTGFWVGNDAASKLNINTTSNNHVVHAFKRAPGFFDIVAYTGTGSARTVSHNLGVAPELMIVKYRGGSQDWGAYHSALGATKALYLNTNTADATSSIFWNNTSPTSSVFTVESSSVVNGGGGTYIAYLFASCSGVSKVGSYTGTGTTLSIDCGFTAGARFVLIKRTDSTGDWYVWDTARGIVSADDPYLLLNSTAAEVTNTDYIDPLNSGFQISSTAPAAINANGGTYLYFSVA